MASGSTAGSVLSDPPNYFYDSGDEQLDLVLQEAARLAAEMRAASGSRRNPDNDDNNNGCCDYEDEMPLPEQPSFMLETDLSTIAPVLDIPTNVDIPNPHLNEDCTLQSESTLAYAHTAMAHAFQTNNNKINGVERFTLHATCNGDLNPVSVTEEVAATIRASEEMAKALEALGAFPVLSESSSETSRCRRRRRRQHEQPNDISLLLPDPDPEPAKVESAAAAAAGGGGGGRGDSTKDFVALREYSSEKNPPVALASSSVAANNWTAVLAKEAAPLLLRPGAPQPKRLDPYNNNNNSPLSPTASQTKKDVASPPALAEAGTGASPWLFYSMGLSPVISAKQDEPPAAAENPAITPCPSKDKLFDPNIPDTAKPSPDTSARAVSKSRELRERLRQTEAEYARLKNRPVVVADATAIPQKIDDDDEEEENQRPNWLKLDTLSAQSKSHTAVTSVNVNENQSPTSSKENGDWNWEKIADAERGDDDFMSLRDYTLPQASPTTVPPAIQRKKSPPVSGGPVTTKLTWTKLEEPRAGDHDFVPLRGSATVFRTVDKMAAAPDTAQENTAAKLKMARNLFQGPGAPKDGDKDYTSMKDYSLPGQSSESKLSVGNVDSKLSVGNVKWERVDYALENDDDWVPLKDYSKTTLSATTGSWSAASTASSRTLSPSNGAAAAAAAASTLFDYGAGTSEDEYEIVMEAYRSNNYENEGPTALELKRRRQKQKRRKKMIQYVVISTIWLLVIPGCVFYFYYYSKESPPTKAIKRDQYNNKDKKQSSRLPARRAQPSSPCASQPSSPAAPPLPPQPSSSSQEPFAQAQAQEQPVPKLPSAPASAPRAPKIAERDMDYIRLGPAPFCGRKFQSSTGGTSFEEESVGNNYNSETNQEVFVVVGREVVPPARICFVPLGYLLSDRCSKETKAQRLEKLLQAMFQ